MKEIENQTDDDYIQEHKMMNDGQVISNIKSMNFQSEYGRNMEKKINIFKANDSNFMGQVSTIQTTAHKKSNEESHNVIIN
jgi:hypothetical protein